MQDHSNKNSQLTFHHTGLLVKSIKAVLPVYESMFGSDAVSPSFYISSQQVTVCFIKIGDAAFLELVEPAEGNVSFQAYFKRGIHYYHIGYEVAVFEAALQLAEQNGFRLLNTFQSEAFGGRRCAFLINDDMHLIELIEAP